jgi:hypothetical protein
MRDAMSSGGSSVPRAILVVGYSALALGLLVLGGGLALASESAERLEFLVAGTQVVVGSAMVVAALALLGRRRWGARALQIMAILLLAGLAAFGAAWTTLHLPRAFMPDGAMLLLIGVVVVAAYAVPLIFVVRTLRSPRIEEQLK